MKNGFRPLSSTRQDMAREDARKELGLSVGKSEIPGFICPLCVQSLIFTMETSLFPLVFALAHDRGTLPYKANVLFFGSDSLALRRHQQNLWASSYAALEKITYQDGESMRGMWGVLGGGFFRRRGARFLVQTADASLEIRLEMDAMYRRGELRRLFEEMYREGLPLHEITAQQMPAFLFESMSRKAAQEKIAELQG